MGSPQATVGCGERGSQSQNPRIQGGERAYFRTESTDRPELFNRKAEPVDACQIPAHSGSSKVCTSFHFPPWPVLSEHVLCPCSLCLLLSPRVLPLSCSALRDPSLLFAFPACPVSFSAVRKAFAEPPKPLQNSGAVMEYVILSRLL